MINKYKPNYKLYAHVDNIKLYDNIICILSLKSDCIVRFKEISKSKYNNFKPKYTSSNSTYDILVKSKSLYIMKDKSRYDFTHEIIPIESDNERLSIVFRTII